MDNGFQEEATIDMYSAAFLVVVELPSDHLFACPEPELSDDIFGFGAAISMPVGDPGYMDSNR